VIFTNVKYQAGGLDGGMFFKKVPALKAYLAGSPYAGSQKVCSRSRVSW